MLKFFLDHLNTKKMGKNAVKRSSFVIMYIPDQNNTQEIHDKVILNNDGICGFIPDSYSNLKLLMKLLITILIY